MDHPRRMPIASGKKLRTIWSANRLCGYGIRYQQSFACHLVEVRCNHLFIPHTAHGMSAHLIGKNIHDIGLPRRLLSSEKLVPRQSNGHRRSCGLDELASCQCLHIISLFFPERHIAVRIVSTYLETVWHPLPFGLQASANTG